MSWLFQPLTASAAQLLGTPVTVVLMDLSSQTQTTYNPLVSYSATTNKLSQSQTNYDVNILANQSVSSTLLTETQTTYAPLVNYVATTNSISFTQTLYPITLASQATIIDITLLSQTQTTYDPLVNYVATTNNLTQSQTTYAPLVSYSATTNKLSQTQTTYDATIRFTLPVTTLTQSHTTYAPLVNFSVNVNTLTQTESTYAVNILANQSVSSTLLSQTQTTYAPLVNYVATTNNITQTQTLLAPNLLAAESIPVTKLAHNQTTYAPLVNYVATTNNIVQNTTLFAPQILKSDINSITLLNVTQSTLNPYINKQEIVPSTKLAFNQNGLGGDVSTGTFIDVTRLNFTQTNNVHSVNEKINITLLSQTQSTYTINVFKSETIPATKLTQTVSYYNPSIVFVPGAETSTLLAFNQTSYDVNANSKIDVDKLNIVYTRHDLDTTISVDVIVDTMLEILQQTYPIAGIPDLIAPDKCVFNTTTYNPFVIRRAGTLYTTLTWKQWDDLKLVSYSKSGAIISSNVATVDFDIKQQVNTNVIPGYFG